MTLPWRERPLRIVHLNTDGWYEREGIARAVTALADRLPHEHHLLAQTPDGDVWAGHHAVDASPVRMPWHPGAISAVERINPDVIHLHGGSAAALLAGGPAFAGRPVVVSVHRVVESPLQLARPLVSLGDARGARISIGRSALVAAAGLAITRRALARGRVAVVCTPDERFAASLRRFGRVVITRGAAARSDLRAQWSDDPTIVFAGRAELGRGVDDLLAAYRILRRRRPRVRLRLLLLEGPALRRWQAEAGDGVEVRADAFGDLETELARAQAAAVPFRLSMTMTPALVAAEAMAVGLPVVVTDVGCLRPLVTDGFNGAIVAPRDPQALATALETMLASETRWRELSAAASNTIERNWSWDQAASAVDGVYRSLSQMEVLAK